MRSHYKIRPFKCPKCLRCFSRKAVLQFHLKSHINSKPYFCLVEGCKKFFSSKPQLKYHVKKHNALPSISFEEEFDKLFEANKEKLEEYRKKSNREIQDLLLNNPMIKTEIPKFKFINKKYEFINKEDKITPLDNTSFSYNKVEKTDDNKEERPFLKNKRFKVINDPYIKQENNTVDEVKLEENVIIANPIQYTKSDSTKDYITLINEQLTLNQSKLNEIITNSQTIFTLIQHFITSINNSNKLIDQQLSLHLFNSK